MFAQNRIGDITFREIDHQKEVLGYLLCLVPRLRFCKILHLCPTLLWIEQSDNVMVNNLMSSVGLAIAAQNPKSIITKCLEA